MFYNCWSIGDFHSETCSGISIFSSKAGLLQLGSCIVMYWLLYFQVMTLLNVAVHQLFFVGWSFWDQPCSGNEKFVASCHQAIYGVIWNLCVSEKLGGMWIRWIHVMRCVPFPFDPRFVAHGHCQLGWIYWQFDFRKYYIYIWEDFGKTMTGDGLRTLLDPMRPWCRPEKGESRSICDVRFIWFSIW